MKVKKKNKILNDIIWKIEKNVYKNKYRENMLGGEK